MKMKNVKKGQEEIVGFVLIILLVSVIAVIFLAISMRKPLEKLPSTELESFLQSSMRVSTSCSISKERVYSFKEVISSCAETNDKCLNDKTACDTLNETAARILADNWRVCEDCPTKSYKFSVKMENRTIYSLKEGNCSGNRVYSDLEIHSYSGKVTAGLEICG
jgi:hypothetical protein